MVFNALNPLLARMLSKQNQVMLPIIIDSTENMKNILPRIRQRFNTVPLKAIHKDGVVGLRNVIRKPAKKPLDVYELSLSAKVDLDEFLDLEDSLVNNIKTSPDTIQNNPSNRGWFTKILNKPRFINII